MDPCCIESLALLGIATGFTVTPEGGGHTCDRCGRYYQIVNGTWTPAFRCPSCGAVSFNPNDIVHSYCGRCHVFVEDQTPTSSRVEGGQYLQQRRDGGLEQVGPGEPDVVVARRVADYPLHLPPAGAATGLCAKCGATIAFNPKGPWPHKPRICLQCGGIQPLPIPRTAG